MGYLPSWYVWVHTRIEQFHKKYQEWSIETAFELTQDIVYFKATIYTDKDKLRSFTWSSFWKINKEKAFEKLETVAVGRALAFAGFETQSWIASREEMENFEENNQKQEDEKPWIDDKIINLISKKIQTTWEIPSIKDVRNKYKVSRANATKLESMWVK